MTTDPAPDPAAVQIAADAIPIGVTHARRVVAALTRHYDLCPPGTLARVAPLEKVAEAAGEYYAQYLAPTWGFTSAKWDALVAALDAAPAGTTAEGESGAGS